MPGFDGTGPRGLGPKTGGGRGFCPPGGQRPYEGYFYGTYPFGGYMPRGSAFGYYPFTGFPYGFGVGRCGFQRGGGRGRAFGGGRGRWWR